MRSAEIQWDEYHFLSRVWGCSHRISISFNPTFANWTESYTYLFPIITRAMLQPPLPELYHSVIEPFTCEVFVIHEVHLWGTMTIRTLPFVVVEK
jgi:hypothetical protein